MRLVAVWIIAALIAKLIINRWKSLLATIVAIPLAWLAGIIASVIFGMGVLWLTGSPRAMAHIIGISFWASGVSAFWSAIKTYRVLKRGPVVYGQSSPPTYAKWDGSLVLKNPQRR